jgi:hypothetical protein
VTVTEYTTTQVRPSGAVNVWVEVPLAVVNVESNMRSDSRRSEAQPGGGGGAICETTMRLDARSMVPARPDVEETAYRVLD